MITPTRTFFAAAALLATVSAVPAQGVLIADDPFLTGNPANPAAGEYDPGVLVSGTISGGGQDPDILGFVDPWASNRSGVAQWTATDGSVEDPTGDFTGGRARFAGVDNLQRRVHRDLAAYTAVDTYYMSFVMTAALGDTDGDGFVGVGFTNDATDAELDGSSDGLFGALVGFKANPGGTTDLVMRFRDQTSPGVFGATDEVLLANVASAGTENDGVYRVVLKLDHNAAPFNPDGEDVLTAWVNPGLVSSEAQANAAVTPTSVNTFALPNNSLITQLTFTGIDYSRPASFDEFRLGTEFADVIPEPSVAALVAAGLACVVRRRRASA